MKKFLLCFLVLVFYSTSAFAQIPVCVGRPSCGPGNCLPSYSGPSCNVAYGTSLQYDIVNIVEQDRMYVKVKAWNRIYTLPVINGYLPEITQKTGPYDLILDYKSKVRYDREIYGGNGYVVYTLPDSSSATIDKINVLDGPSGMKGPDYVSKAKQSQSLSRPSDDEVDQLLNGSTSKAIRSEPSTRKIPRRPSDDEIDNLLNF